MSNDTFISQRIRSLDVFRGITIVLMILVNSPGTAFPYPWLAHATWHGCTLADLVFPSFLFVVGMTTVISLNKQLNQPGLKYGMIYSSIVKRSLILFAIGLFLNAYPLHFDFASLRYYGVLQRIAVCYCIGSLIYLNTSVKTQILIFIAILGGYWIVMALIPVPGYGANQLTEATNWEAYIDQMLFSSKHLFEKVYDPEGFLSTFPSIATTLIGIVAGSWLLTDCNKQKKVYVLIAFGWLFLILGWLWNFSFPINKNIWTSSFVLWSGGYALIGFALCYLLIDIFGLTKWSFVFKVFGMNALFAFIFHVLLLKTQMMFQLTLSTGAKGNLKYYITDYLFPQYLPQNASLFYSLLFILLNFLVVGFLYKRKIFIRI